MHWSHSHVHFVGGVSCEGMSAGRLAKEPGRVSGEFPCPDLARFPVFRPVCGVLQGWASPGALGLLSSAAGMLPCQAAACQQPRWQPPLPQRGFGACLESRMCTTCTIECDAVVAESCCGSQGSSTKWRSSVGHRSPTTTAQCAVAVSASSFCQSWCLQRCCRSQGFPRGWRTV